MKEMTWKSRLNRLFAHRFALPVLCWCAALVFWLVQGAVAFAGDSSAKAKGTLTETSIPIESWQLAELTWGEPGENSAPQGQLITTGGDPQMILEDVSGRVVRTVSYNVEFDGDSREMCLYYTTKTGEPYSQDRRVFPKVLADGTYVYTLPRTQIVALRLDPGIVVQRPGTDEHHPRPLLGPREDVTSAGPAEVAVLAGRGRVGGKVAVAGRDLESAGVHGENR